MLDVEEKLRRYSLQKKEIEKINKHLSILDVKLDKAYAEIKTLDKKAEIEALDVQRLENDSMRVLFLKILGRGDEALDLEKQEMLLAYINLRKANESLEILEYEKAILTKKLMKLDFDPEDFEVCLRFKERKLEKIPHVRHQIVSIDLKLDRLTNITKEIHEAVEATKELEEAFQNLQAEISKIDNWNQGVYTLKANTYLSDFAKKRYVKSNIALLSKIEIIAEKVNRELADLKRRHELDVIKKLTIINNFFDVFFDNLLTDWIVKKGLKSTKKTLEICFDKITRMLLTLDRELAIAKEATAELTEERQNIIISADLD